MSGPESKPTGVLIKKRTGHRHTQREDRVKTEGEDSFPRAREEPTLLTPCPQASGLQNCKNIDVCCLSRTVCGVSWRAPEQTRMSCSPEGAAPSVRGPGDGRGSPLPSHMSHLDLKMLILSFHLILLFTTSPSFRPKYRGAAPVPERPQSPRPRSTTQRQLSLFPRFLDSSKVTWLPWVAGSSLPSKGVRSSGRLGGSVR